MSKSVSIIVRTYNEEKYLPELLEGISQQDVDFDYEVIVVDSGSTDNTLKIVEDSGHKIVHIRKEDFSFGRSLNYGCEAAKGDYLVFISAHCIPCDQKWLNELVKPFEDEQVALCYGRQVGYDVSKFSEHRVFAKYFPARLQDQQGGFFCNNANSAIRSSFWKSEKQFDEDLTGLEDMDWAKHFYQSGRKIQYCPDSVIFHIHEESWKKVKIRYEREAYALKEIMPEIHFNFIDLIRSIFRGIFNDMKQAIKQKVLFSRWREIVMFRICQFYGSYRGHHIHRKISKQSKQRYFYP